MAGWIRWGRVRAAMAGGLVIGGLSACGGGGGDPGTQPSRSGLMPEPPAVGAVLLDDASSLHPARDGSSYVYLGSTGAIHYVNQVRQQASSGGFDAQTSNLFNEGADQAGYSVGGGSVTLVQRIDLTGDGRVDLESLLELRSPVRLDDQYAVADLHLPGSVPDQDGDSFAETADIALYRHVVGWEAVTLPSLPTQQALRVDLVLLYRITGSASQQASAVSTTTQSIWYVPGLGIVRQRLSGPGLSADERLSSVTP